MIAERTRNINNPSLKRKQSGAYRDQSSNPTDLLEVNLPTQLGLILG